MNTVEILILCIMAVCLVAWGFVIFDEYRYNRIAKKRQKLLSEDEYMEALRCFKEEMEEKKTLKFRGMN